MNDDCDWCSRRYVVSANGRRACPDHLDVMWQEVLGPTRALIRAWRAGKLGG